MKVTIIGIARRKTTNKEGRPVTYSTIYYSVPFDDYSAKANECLGLSCGKVNTALDTEGLFDGDTINLDFAPSGFVRNGQEEYTLRGIDMIKQRALNTGVKK